MKKKRLESRIVKGQALKLVQKLEMKFASDNVMESLKNQNQEIQIKLKESSGSTAKRKLIVTVEGIHTGLTKNLTFYTPETLSESVPTWTTPHYKPILTNHNEYSDPLGRIKDVQFVESSLVAGKNTLRMKLEILNQEAIDKVLDGRFLTLSVGGSANKVVCSTCGKNIITEGFCGHYRGRKYEGKSDATHWIIGEYTGDEISFVNMPADVFAQVITAELVTTEGGQSEMKKKKKKAGKTAESNELDLIGNLTEDENDTGNDEGDEGDEGDDDLDDDVGDESDNNDDDDIGDDDEGDDDDVGDESDNNDDNPDDSDEGDDDEDDGDDLGEKVKNLEASIVEKDTEIAALKKRAEDAEKQNATLTTENASLMSDLDDAKTELAEAKENLTSAEEERDDFQKQSLKLARFSKKLLAERVADLRIMQKKDKPEDRESVIETWLASTPKVLESTIKDLMASGHRFIGRVTSPGLAVQDQNGDQSVDGDGNITEYDKKPQKKLTFADFEESTVSALTRSL